MGLGVLAGVITRATVIDHRGGHRAATVDVFDFSAEELNLQFLLEFVQ